MILILFGVGVVAQVVAGDGGLGDHDRSPGPGASASRWASTSRPASAARTSTRPSRIALAAFKGFPWRKVLPYVARADLGAFVAALIVRWNYADVIAAVDPGHTHQDPGHLLHPARQRRRCRVGIWAAFRDQVIGTAILLFLILAVTDARNTAPLANLAPVHHRPARRRRSAWPGAPTPATPSTRPVTSGRGWPRFLTGYGAALRDQYGELYFWVPIVGPLIGGLIGAGLYKVLVGALPARRGRARGARPGPDRTEHEHRLQPPTAQRHTTERTRHG